MLPYRFFEFSAELHIVSDTTANLPNDLAAAQRAWGLQKDLHLEVWQANRLVIQLREKSSHSAPDW
jgi:hypothetical protein